MEKGELVLDSCNVRVLLIFQGKSAHPAVFSLRSFDFLPPPPPPPPPCYGCKVRLPVKTWMRAALQKLKPRRKKIAKYGKYVSSTHSHFFLRQKIILLITIWAFQFETDCYLYLVAHGLAYYTVSLYCRILYTVKKGYRLFPSPAGMSVTKLSLAGNN